MNATSMSFYQQQKTAQRNIRLLLVLFVGCALSLVGAITLIVAAALRSLADELSLDGSGIRLLGCLCWLF